MSMPCGSKIGVEMYSAKSAPRMGRPEKTTHRKRNPTVAGLAGSEISFQKRMLDEDGIPVSLSADAVQLDETARGREGGRAAS